MTDLHEIRSCVACASTLSEQIHSIDIDHHHRQFADDEATVHRLRELLSITTTGYRVRRCMSCGLEYADPLAAPSAAWYEEAYKRRQLFASSRWEFGVVLLQLGPQDAVLEVGCGTGGFLEKCRERQIVAAGLDFSEHAIAICRHKQLTAQRFDLSRSLAGHVPAPTNVLVAFHVLEHLDRPDRFLRDLRREVTAGSRLFVSIPSDRRPSRRFRDRDFMDEPPHHMSRWSESSLRAIGTRTGWNLRTLTYEPMPLRAATWSITVAAPAYRYLKSKRLIRHRFVERAFRYLYFPFGAVDALGPNRKLSGFSMLACFQADNDGAR